MCRAEIDVNYEELSQLWFMRDPDDIMGCMRDITAVHPGADGDELLKLLSGMFNYINLRFSVEIEL